MPRQHQSKTVNKLFKELERIGFQVYQKKSGSYTIIPSNKNLPIYNTHGTESCLHPIRRDFRKLYGVDVEALL
jgi:glyoxylate utilization-related uncharacterized protein